MVSDRSCIAAYLRGEEESIQVKNLFVLQAVDKKQEDLIPAKWHPQFHNTQPDIGAALLDANVCQKSRVPTERPPAALRLG